MAHVVPPKWSPEDYPLPEDTVEAREGRSGLLHSIGNLTLVTPSFDSTLSNEPFRIKRSEIAANSSLMLQACFQKLSDADNWNEATIIACAEILSPCALKMWPHPAPGS